MGTAIRGTGIAVPPRVVTNDDLARVMDTSDEWIRKRTGVAQRHLCDPGTAASHLAIDACRAAMHDAGITPDDVDLLITATMTPDNFVPGIAPQVQTGLGLGPVGAYDLRQQCSGFLYGLDAADAAITTGRADTVVVVGAESHSGYIPLGDSWELLRGERDGSPTEDDWRAATEARNYSVLFGDGAGAMVLQRGDDRGVLASTLHTDGTLFDLIRVRAAGFANQPWLDQAQLDANLHAPTFSGLELFRQAARLMPQAVETVAERAGIELSDIDLVVAHQANERILDAVRSAMGVDAALLPSNIDRYGNTTAATLPILFHEMRAAGRVHSGALVCFTAFGAGAHWGALLYEQP